MATSCSLIIKLKCMEEWNTGRKVSLDTGGFDLISTYNQPLCIGNGGGHPKPAEMYVRLHELLAGIFKMRGQAGYYQYDSNDEECEVDMVKHTYQRQDTSQTNKNCYIKRKELPRVAGRYSIYE
jgi:hypothetical protein